MAILSVLFLAIVLPAACFYVYRRFFSFKAFKREGIPGPAPHWLHGNAASFANPSTRHLIVPAWTKAFGKLFGYYEGPRPILVSSDPEFISQVFVKNFGNFHGHKPIPFHPNPDTSTEIINMFAARGDRWKRLRTIINPSFSAAKLRSLQPLMNKCQNDFMGLIEQKAESNEAFDIFECFQYLTLDTISETAFGIELNSAKTAGKVANPLLDSLREYFAGMLKGISIFFKLATVIPEAATFFRKADLAVSKMTGTGTMNLRMKMYDMLDKVIAQRRANPSNRVDLLQMMLDQEESKVGQINGLKGLTVEEIQGQALVFVLGGYETSSNALAFISFLLANHSRVQDNLLQEIDKHFHDPSKVPDYDSVQDLTYMDAVINETLRLYPVIPLLVNRVAMEDCTVNGVNIAKGTTVLADIWSIHRDEEHWGPVDPTLFYPERFLDGYPGKDTRHDAAFMAFGLGPRICIGQRFGLFEIKATLVNLLRKYRIAKAVQTGEEMKLMSSMTMSVEGGVYVKLVPRHLAHARN